MSPAAAALAIGALQPAEEASDFTAMTTSVVKQLSRVPASFVSLLHDRQTAHLAAICTRVDVPEGQVLYREGDVADSLGIVLSGRLELILGVAPLLHCVVGDLVGEIELCRPFLRHGENVRRHTLVARENSVIANISFEGFERFVESVGPRPAKRLSRHLADYVLGKVAREEEEAAQVDRSRLETVGVTRRMAVSAPCGADLRWNPKIDDSADGKVNFYFEKPLSPGMRQPPLVTAAIERAIACIPMLAEMDSEVKKKVIESFLVTCKKSGQSIIDKGQRHEYFGIVFKGQCGCYEPLPAYAAQHVLRTGSDNVEEHEKGSPLPASACRSPIISRSASDESRASGLSSPIGSFGRAAFALQSGKKAAAQLRRLADGESQKAERQRFRLQRRIEEGQWFGETGLVGGFARSDDAVKAIGNVTLLMLPVSTFREIRERHERALFQRRMQLVQDAPFGKYLDGEELCKLADALVPRQFKAGEAVITVDTTDCYILQSGVAVEMKSSSDMPILGRKLVLTSPNGHLDDRRQSENNLDKVQEHHEGSCFCEWNLRANDLDPVALSALPLNPHILAKSACLFLVLDRSSFVDIIGSYDALVADKDPMAEMDKTEAGKAILPDKEPKNLGKKKRKRLIPPKVNSPLNISAASLERAKGAERQEPGTHPKVQNNDSTLSTRDSSTIESGAGTTHPRSSDHALSQAGFQDTHEGQKAYPQSLESEVDEVKDVGCQEEGNGASFANTGPADDKSDAFVRSIADHRHVPTSSPGRQPIGNVTPGWKNLEDPSPPSSSDLTPSIQPLSTQNDDGSLRIIQEHTEEQELPLQGANAANLKVQIPDLDPVLMRGADTGIQKEACPDTTDGSDGHVGLLSDTVPDEDLLVVAENFVDDILRRVKAEMHADTCIQSEAFKDETSAYGAQVDLPSRTGSSAEVDLAEVAEEFVDNIISRVKEEIQAIGKGCMWMTPSISRVNSHEIAENESAPRDSRSGDSDEAHRDQLLPETDFMSFDDDDALSVRVAGADVLQLSPVIETPRSASTGKDLAYLLTHATPQPKVESRQIQPPRTPVSAALAEVVGQLQEHASFQPIACEWLPQPNAQQGHRTSQPTFGGDKTGPRTPDEKSYASRPTTGSGRGAGLRSLTPLTPVGPAVVGKGLGSRPETTGTPQLNSLMPPSPAGLGISRPVTQGSVPRTPGTPVMMNPQGLTDIPSFKTVTPSQSRGGSRQQSRQTSRMPSHESRLTNSPQPSGTPKIDMRRSSSHLFTTEEEFLAPARHQLPAASDFYASDSDDDEECSRFPGMPAHTVTFVDTDPPRALTKRSSTQRPTTSRSSQPSLSPLLSDRSRSSSPALDFTFACFEDRDVHRGDIIVSDAAPWSEMRMRLQKVVGYASTFTFLSFSPAEGRVIVSAEDEWARCLEIFRNHLGELQDGVLEIDIVPDNETMPESRGTSSGRALDDRPTRPATSRASTSTPSAPPSFRATDQAPAHSQNESLGANSHTRPLHEVICDQSSENNERGDTRSHLLDGNFDVEQPWLQEGAPDRNTMLPLPGGHQPSRTSQDKKPKSERPELKHQKEVQQVQRASVKFGRSTAPDAQRCNVEKTLSPKKQVGRGSWSMDKSSQHPFLDPLERRAGELPGPGEYETPKRKMAGGRVSDSRPRTDVESKMLDAAQKPGPGAYSNPGSDLPAGGRINPPGPRRPPPEGSHAVLLSQAHYQDPLMGPGKYDIESSFGTEHRILKRPTTRVSTSKFPSVIAEIGMRRGAATPGPGQYPVRRKSLRDQTEEMLAAKERLRKVKQLADGHRQRAATACEQRRQERLADLTMPLYRSPQTPASVSMFLEKVGPVALSQMQLPDPKVLCPEVRAPLATRRAYLAAGIELQ